MKKESARETESVRQTAVPPRLLALQPPSLSFRCFLAPTFFFLSPYTTDGAIVLLLLLQCSASSACVFINYALSCCWISREGNVVIWKVCLRSGAGTGRAACLALFIKYKYTLACSELGSTLPAPHAVVQRGERGSGADTGKRRFSRWRDIDIIIHANGAPLALVDVLPAPVEGSTRVVSSRRVCKLIFFFFFLFVSVFVDWDEGERESL